MMSLTRKQADLLEYVEGYQTEHHGVSPSFEEMKAALGLKSKSGVHRLLSALEERRRIIRPFHRARAIEIVRDGPEVPALHRYATNELVAELARRSYTRRRGTA